MGFSKWVAKLSKLQTKNTPNCDKLGHYYWGDILWSNIGYIAAIIISFSWPQYYLLILPFITVAIPAWSKEKSDGDGYGNKEFKDWLFTVIPSFLKIIVLFIIIYLQR